MSASSVHIAFGGREGLLAAVFEQHAPLPAVERLLSQHPEWFIDFETGVRAIYTVVFDTVVDDTAVLEALFAETLGKPNGMGMQLFRDEILPRITATVGAWLGRQIDAGHCADVPLALLIPLLISPISVHLLARNRLAAAGASVPDRDTVIDVMTAAFCGSVGLSSLTEGGASLKAVVITGASTGIGRACALTLDREGFQVFAGVRKEADGDALRAAASAALTPVSLDITDAPAIAAMTELVTAAVGDAGLAGLVNNAGTTLPCPVGIPSA